MIRHRYNLNGKRDARRGFTLIELLVVIVIIGILAAIAVPIYLNQRVVAWKATVVSDVHNAAKQVELASYHGDGSLIRLSDYRVKPADDTTGGSPTIIADKTFANADGKYDGKDAAKQVELASYHGDGSLTQLSDYRVKPAGDTASGSPTIIADKTFTNADGKYDGHDTIGSEPVPVSAGNTLEVQIKSDNSYTIYGVNTHVNDWVYRYDSARGTGEWEPGSYPSDPSAPDPDDDCLVVRDGTKLIIGKDGTRCKLSTAMVDNNVDNVGDPMRGKVTEIDLHGHVVIVDGSYLFHDMTSLTSVPYLPGQSVTSSVNGVSYSGMFAYNSKLAVADSISHWDTRNVTDMSLMFHFASSFNQSVSNFNTSNVTDMSLMFHDATAFNQPVPFNTRNVTNMEGMFAGAPSFNQSVSNFDTRNVTDMISMFDGASSFNQPVPFNTSNVTDMNYMFNGASSFNQSVSSFDTRDITDMGGMFREASSFNQPVSNFDTSKVTEMWSMFQGATAFNQDLTGWNVNNVTDHSRFSDGSALTGAHLPHFTS